MSDLPLIPARPQTPQAMLHRLPDKPDASISDTKPSKYIVLIMGGTGAAGKVQIAKSVSKALSCPVFNGDSMHESSAKAASVGASRRPAATSEEAIEGTGGGSGANETRYRRMWLSKMTRTGLLFPEESRPATEGFSGFGGDSGSTSTSRRGSGSSVASTTSDAALSVSSAGSSFVSSTLPPTAISQYINKPPTLSTFTLSDAERQRRVNPVLMVLTHPELESWHREAIRQTTGEYGIGILFVPLYEDEQMELPLLKPLDPRTMTSFGSLTLRPKGGSLEEEMALKIDYKASVEDIIEEIIEGVRDFVDIEL